MSFDEGQYGRGEFQRSPAGPRVARMATARPVAPPPGHRSKRHVWSVLLFALLISGVGIRAYRDLSRPETWAYWKESYLGPKMISALLPGVDFDGPGHGRRALAISGEIGAASANATGSTSRPAKPWCCRLQAAI